MFFWLCTALAHNTTEKSSHNLPSYLETNIYLLSIGGEGTHSIGHNIMNLPHTLSDNSLSLNRFWWQLKTVLDWGEHCSALIWWFCNSSANTNLLPDSLNPQDANMLLMLVYRCPHGNGCGLPGVNLPTRVQCYDSATSTLPHSVTSAPTLPVFCRLLKTHIFHCSSMSF